MLVNKHQITKKMFFNTMIVLIIAELTGAFTCIIDGLITSRCLGNDAMAAFGIANSYFSVVSIISGILLVGCQSLCIGTISKGNKEESNRIVSITALLGITLSTLIALIIIIFPGAIASLFGAKSDAVEVYELVKEYLRTVAIGAPFWLLSVVLTPIIQLDGGGRRAKVSAIVSCVVDIVLDFVLGVWLKMGMKGMGLATALSHIASAIVIVSFFFSKKSSIKFSLKNLYISKILEILKNGMPRAISMISRTIGPILLNIIVINIDISSNSGMTALSVQRSISFFVASIGWGICGTVLMLEEMNYNNKNISELKAVIGYALKSILLFVVTFSLLLYIASPYIARIFLTGWKEDDNLYQLSIVSLRYFVLSLPFVAINISFASYIQSVGKMMVANIINVFVECVSLVSACYFLTRIRDYYGFFAGFFVGEAMLSLVICLYVIVNRLIHKKEKYSLYFIKEGCINENDRIMEATITSVDDVMALSEKAYNLCQGTHLTNSQIYKISLAIEEMAMNVFKHGITKDNKKHYIEIRVVVSDTNAIITLIDDCKKFDITKKLLSWAIDKDAPEKNMGIRTIMLIASKVIYTNTMNINNLQIII